MQRAKMETTNSRHAMCNIINYIVCVLCFRLSAVVHNFHMVFWQINYNLWSWFGWNRFVAQNSNMQMRRRHFIHTTFYMQIYYINALSSHTHTHIHAWQSLHLSHFVLRLSVRLASPCPFRYVWPVCVVCELVGNTRDSRSFAPIFIICIFMFNFLHERL